MKHGTLPSDEELENVKYKIRNKTLGSYLIKNPQDDLYIQDLETRQFYSWDKKFFTHEKRVEMKF